MSEVQEGFYRITLEDILSSFRKHDKDCGSSCAQIITLTEQIINVTTHMKRHQKDFSTRRGLLEKVNKRKKLLAYLNKNDHELFLKLKEALHLR